MKFVLPDFDKPHRCPGRPDDCGGYITFGMSYDEYAALDYHGETYQRYPRPYALGQCTQCARCVLPFWVRRLSVPHMLWLTRFRINNWRYNR